MKTMLTSFFLVLGLLAQTTAFSSVKTSVTDGNWFDAAIWSPAGVPFNEDTLIINHNVFVDDYVDVGINLLWIESGNSLTGDSIFGLHGNLLVDGHIGFTYVLAVGDGNFTTVNGTVDVNKWATSNTVFTNNGNMVVDSLITGNPSFFNEGSITSLQLVTSDDFTNNGTITAGELITGDQVFTNDGQVICTNWTHGGGTVTGTTGRFCISQCFLNAAAITGTVDICDANPNQFCDINMGTIGSGVTFCQAPICSSGVGINDFEAAEMHIQIFPNPASEHVTISLEGMQSNTYNLTVYTMQGERIYAVQNTSGAQQSLDVSAFATGIYVLEVASETQVVRSRLVVR